MSVLQINDRVETMRRAGWERRYADAAAQKFLSADGLVWTLSLDGETNSVGGFHLFSSRAHADAWLAVPMVAGMKANPNIADLSLLLSDGSGRQIPGA